MIRVVSNDGHAARGAGTAAVACRRVLGGLVLMVAAMLGLSSEGRAQGLEFNANYGLRVTAPERTLSAPRRLGAAIRPSRKAVKHTRKKRRGVVQKAAYVPEPKATAPSGSLSGGHGIRWAANSGCLASNLRAVIAHISANYGHVTVNSTCRSARHNRRVGGARRSHHLTGNAADLRVRGNIRGAYAYLRGLSGGLKHYGGGLFHIDNGPKRRF